MTCRGSDFLRWSEQRSGTRRTRRLLVLASAMLLPGATRAQESTSAPPAARIQARAHAGLVSDLLDEIAQAESKIVALARALPESASDWRPMAGVRSAHEVMVHVAAESFYAAAKWGGRADPATMVTGATHSESDAYER
ncbi:MAG TPA: hypothetical protein VE869_14055, partial [Gemmatimonas sp.]|nr:hypothetical protein [Gemmatimonas sp.]